MRCIELCPSGLLVSGGDDGVKFWNVTSGKLRGEIKTTTGVVGAIFSEQHSELIVAERCNLFVYSLCPKVAKLAEKALPDGIKIENMTAGPNGTMVCTCDNESLLMYIVDRTGSKTKLKRKVVPTSDFMSLEEKLVIR